MRPRYTDKPDGNKAEIVDALKEAGAKVIDMRPPVAGEPELVVGFLGQLTLLEVKTAKGRLSDAQKDAHWGWARVGVKVHTVRNIREAFEAAGIAGPVSSARREAMRELAESFEVAQPTRRRRTMNARLQSSIRNYNDDSRPLK